VQPVCRNCRKRIKRTRYPGGKLEQLSRYRNRRYCSLRCHRIVRNEEASFPIKPWMREYLKAFDRYLRSDEPAWLVVMSRVFENRPKGTR
jgi:hypothetical protein